MRPKSLVPVTLACLLAVALLTGCQGKGPDTYTLVEHYTEVWNKDSAPLAMSDTGLAGTYTLAGFTYEYLSRLGTWVDTKTEADFESYSGNMSISASSVTMTVGATGRANIVQNWWLFVPEETVSFSYSGVSWIDTGSFPQSGVFADVSLDGAYYGDLPFTAGTDRLTIDYGYYEVAIVGSVLPATASVRSLSAH